MVCAKGDVSAGEEAAFVVAAAGGAAATKPLRAVMHAGAVLESKVIANITAASIRTEYSGERSLIYSAKHFGRALSCCTTPRTQWK